MVTKLEAIRSVKEYTNQFSKSQIRHRGFLGDGDGTVYVADREGYVYVRHRAASSTSITGDMEPEEVLYSRADIPPIEGYPVIFGKDLDTENFQLLAHDNDQLLGWIFDKYIKDHHEQHQFDGYDTVWIQKQALLPLLVHPTSPASFYVQVYQGWYQWDDSWHYMAAVTSADLEGYVPPNVGEARFVLICIDGETETLHYESGDIFPQFLPPVDCEDRIPPPPEGKIPLAALYCVGGMTSFDWDDIYDVRLLFSGGGAMSVGAAPRDASYVTLSYNATLSAERVLTAGHGIIITDNGPDDTVEVAVDTAADYNWSGDHNFNDGEIGLPSGTSFPANPQDSDVFYRTDEDKLYIYDGAGWVEVGILVHNELTGLQGGAANEYYHLDQTAYAELSGGLGGLLHNDLGGLQGGAAGERWHFTQAEHGMLIGGSGVLPNVAAAGYALVSSGLDTWTDDLTPLWLGTHTWGSGLAVMPTDATGQDLGDATHRWDLHTQIVSFENLTTGNNSIVIPDGLADALHVIDTGATEFLRLNTDDDYFLIDPAGAGINVGIGCIPVADFQVGSGNTGMMLQPTWGILSQNIWFTGAAWDSLDHGSVGGVLQVTGGDLAFRTFTAADPPVGTYLLYVKGSTGNVGMGGNTAPTASLEVGIVNETWAGGLTTGSVVAAGGDTAGRIYLEGSAQADVVLDDSGGSADKRIFQMISAAGLTKLRGLNDAASAVTFDFLVLNMSLGYVGIGCAPNSPLEINLTTENLEVVDAGSAAATEQDWIEVEVGGVTGYIRVFAAK